MAGEFGDPTTRQVKAVWDGGTDEVQGEQEQEVMRKLRKITFIQRGEDDEADLVRMELDMDRSRTRGGVESGEGKGVEDDTEEDFELNEGAIAEGGGEPGWESFLPQRHLRVLLAEDDDSTRHVVGALLRNCSYEVTPASNGLQAWELLESGQQQFDLVLTDVVMPGLSGISLLTRIMSMDSQRRVPVIMMSSHDSIDLVLKCFQKGASDFLVKPVRKNELKNLWQHVWRKCNSSSGSGSGSGSQTGRVIVKSRVGSGNESGNSDDDGGDGSGSGSSLNARGSDNGSGTQNDGGSLMQARDKLAEKSTLEGNDPHSGTSQDTPEGDTAMAKSHENGQLRSRSAANQAALRSQDDDRQTTPENPSLSPREQQSSGDEADGMETGGTSTPEIEASPPLVEAIDLLTGVGNVAQQVAQIMKTETQLGEGNGGQVDGGFGSAEVLDRGGSNSPIEDTEPVLELTLKRAREEETEDEMEDRKTLRQSGGSAFSRFVASQQQHPSAQHLTPGTLPAGGFSVPSPFVANPMSPRRSLHRGTGGSSDITTPVLVHPRHLTHNATDLSSPQGLAPTENSFHGPGSTAPPEDAGAMSAPPSRLTPSGMGMGMGMRGPGTMLSFENMPPPYTAFGPAYYGPRGAAQWGTGQRTRRGEMEGYDRPNYVDSGYGEPLPRIMRPHAHHHHHHAQHQQHVPHHHLHHGQPMPAQPTAGSTQEKILAAAMDAATPLQDCGQNGSGSNPWRGGRSGSGGNENGSIVNASSGNGSGSGNGSASGSNNVSNGQKGNGNSNGNSNGQSGQGTTLGATRMAVDGEGGENGNNGSSRLDNGVCNGTNGAINGVMGCGNGNGEVVVGLGQNRSARREAALNKFRQKRKERCFEKKVRYQSRKRLAEQRPRIRGQFVRQTVAGCEG